MEDTHAWHDPLITGLDTCLFKDESEWEKEFNEIMEEASPDTTADDYEDFIWENDPDDNPAWRRRMA